MDLHPGDQLYKFELQRRIDGGAGAFGQVWLAHDHTIDSVVALKILDSRYAPVAQLLNEARIGNRLNHPNLVHIQYADVVTFGGEDLTLIAQEYLPNGSLATRRNATDFVPAPIATRTAVDVLRGLEHLHHEGILHNDIKPSNILYRASGEAVLGDYGISALQGGGTHTPAPNSYVINSAPETDQHGTICVATDIFQVGATLYRVVNGIAAPSFQFQSVGRTAYTERKRLGLVFGPSGEMPFVPSDLRRVIRRATSIDPNQRYSSALEMRRALERVSHPAYWDCDAAGNLVGIGANYTYRITQQQLPRRKWSVTATRTHNTSGRVTRVTDFCASGLTRGEADRRESRFYKWVVKDGG